MHIPVLQKEVLKYLDPKPNENFIDCTIGEGGHTLAILEKNKPKGKVLGIDQDPQLCQKLSKFNFNRLTLVNDSFANLKEIVKRERFKSVSGILFDLGISSWHLEKSGRGFSFLRSEPLDMRYSPQSPLTAEKIVNFWSKSEIEKILREYSQEKFAKKIAEEIIEARKLRPIKTTFQLTGVIKRAVPRKYQTGRIHSATRTFQALRITVNNELNNLETTLPQTLKILKPGGRLVVISFHSLEDRIVKNFYREPALKTLTKKPIRPQKDYNPPSTSSRLRRAPEIKINPRSRSAKLRAAIKL